ncbi:hypothetical protein AWZ03_012061 [Drosophila navojoa]|uniref:Protein kinase domain-containing protein n=1 Tax=Drosophila navojoa TaxID=7232 RepID=A0A484AXZ7_DRONA|nr:hypothetical protein AWZ03_012061 [Drosophila navojoa]
MGITIWELLTRKKPFYHTDYTTDEIFEAVLRGERPSITNIKISITDELKRLIQNCWDSNPYKRPFIQEVIHTLNHILTQEDTDLDQLLKANIGAIVDFEDIKICKKIREDAFGISHKAMWFDTNNGDKIIGTYEKLNYEDIEFIEVTFCLLP